MSVRPIVGSDHEALNRLHRDVGWPERSPAGWRWLEANPARQDIAAPAGWVVADDPRPVPDVSGLSGLVATAAVAPAAVAGGCAPGA